MIVLVSQNSILEFHGVTFFTDTLKSLRLCNKKNERSTKIKLALPVNIKF